MAGSENGKLRESSLSLFSLWHTVHGRENLDSLERIARKEVPWQEVPSRFKGGDDSGKLRCEREGSREHSLRVNNRRINGRSH